MKIEVDETTITTLTQVIATMAKEHDANQWYLDTLETIHTALTTAWERQARIEQLTAEIQVIIDREDYDLAEMRIEAAVVEIGETPEFVGLRTEIDMINFWTEAL